MRIQYRHVLGINDLIVFNLLFNLHRRKYLNEVMDYQVLKFM